MSNVRTVSDTKRAFYEHFDRPVASVYRRVIEELMVEMHLLSVSTDFVYDPVYALGIVTTFDRFMDGYQPEGDRESIFAALCQAVESSAEQYRQDAQRALGMVEALSMQDLKAKLTQSADSASEGIAEFFHAITKRDRFKYSRAFGIGLYTLIEKVDAEFVKDKEKLMALLKEVSGSVKISFDKLQKDIELYGSNLDKMLQAKAVMADILAADRKKREERAQALSEKEAVSQDTNEDSGETVSAPTGDSANEDQTGSST